MDDEAEDLKRVVELRRKARRLRLLADDAAEVAKAAKEVAKEAEAKLAGFLDELADPPPLFAGQAEPIDVNGEVLAGVREAEAGRGEPAWPSDAPDAWRLAPIGELGLVGPTLEALDRHDVQTVGELVALIGEDCLWISEQQHLDINGCLDRFRSRLSDAQLADLDAAQGGGPAPEPKPGRRKKVGA